MKALDPLRGSLSGTTLVEASAGTGKTHTICTLFVRLVAERGLAVQDILVVTFTEAATSELRDRIRARLFAELDGLSRGDASSSELVAHFLAAGADLVASYVHRLRVALESFDRAAIFTIHGFCHRLLREHAFECEVDFEAELVHDDSAFLDEARSDFWLQETHELDPLLLRLLDPRREPRALAKVLAAVAPRPGARVLPEEIQAPDLTALVRYRESLRVLRERWPGDRAEVERILRDDAGLNRTQYRVQWLSSRLAEVDAFLSSETPHEPIAEKHFLRKLSSPAITKGTKAKFTPPVHPFFEATARWEVEANALATIRDDYAVYLRRRFVDVLRRQVPRKKERLGIRFFDDLLTAVDRALRGDRGPLVAARIRERYRAALIDEFQDTDLVQYRIFQSIYGGTDHPLLLIGDPKQAIYAFRGADIFAYLAAVQDTPRPPETLDVNWRSDPKLVHAVELLFRRAERPFLLEGIDLPAVHARRGAIDSLTYRGEPAAPLQLRFLSTTGRAGKNGRVTNGRAHEDLPGLVAADIHRLLNGEHRLGGRPVRPSDVAVLVRSNTEAERYQRAISRLGVPAVSSHTSSVLESEEAGELALILSAIAEPSHASMLRGALGTRLLGLSATEIFELRDDEAGWDRWVARFQGWRQTWHEHGFIHMHRRLMSAQREPGAPATSTRLLATQGGERALTNHLHLAELLHRAALEGHLGVLGLLRWFERAREQAPVSEATELRLETDEDAVKLVTIHKSKGLEYPVVYCPSLWLPATKMSASSRYDEPVIAYHDPSDAHRLSLELRDDEAARRRSDREQQAESLRLAYVALTRAKHLSVVITGHFAASSNSPLGYLVHHRPSGTDAWAETAEHIESLDEAGAWSETRALADSSGGCISASRLDEAPPPSLIEPKRAVHLSGARSRARTLRTTRVISSYSALVRGGSDRDAADHAVLDRGETEIQVFGAPAVESRSGPYAELVPLRDFARTATAGTCFHAILEELDFTLEDRDSLLDLCRSKLVLFGFDPERWSTPVASALRSVVETPLSAGPAPLRLAGVDRGRRSDEFPFLISALGDETGAVRRGVQATDLAQLFGAHASPRVPGGYAAELERLQFPELRGFLKGFVDLVFEHDGRFFVVDYKSNYLGSRFEDYRREEMELAMASGHYFLQYHLYVLALHRYLAARRPGYDYERDFGGVYYLFLKGMSPATGIETGVFFDRPSRELVDGLDRTFGPRTPVRRTA